jgi:hypothetical protein
MEVKVNDRTFDAPVYVKRAEHLIQEIHSLDDALDFLEEWPRKRRGPIYETALKACHRAYSGDVTLEIARNAFIGFARSAGIFEKVDSLLPFPMILQKTGRGGVPA